MMLCVEKSILRLPQICRTFVAFYSKRSDSKLSNSYKVVNSDKAIDDVTNASIGPSSNWELLAPHGYRFFLPGSVGPGWHDASTISQVQFPWKPSRNRKKPIPAIIPNEFKCVIQDCPILLRKGVFQLFPGLNIAECDLSVITLMCEPAAECTPYQQVETDEAVAKYFVLAAQGMCNKLKAEGYWADFINPFSGRPYLSTHQNQQLYEADEKFHCIGFEIENLAECKIITNTIEGYKKFNGSLFTTAPASVLQLKNLFNY